MRGSPAQVRRKSKGLSFGAALFQLSSAEGTLKNILKKA